MPADTPMMRQYSQLKEQHSDCLLFFRLGDFYEMFGDDAVLVSRELDLTLTTRDRNVENPEDRTPMCGVPHHSSEAYIARLVAKGYKIAICEQMEDPAAAKGLVERDVVRVVTPGTVTEPSMLDEGKPNYLAAVYRDADGAAVARVDISTGEAVAAPFAAGDDSHIRNELAAVSPREVLLGGTAADDAGLIEFLTDKLACAIQPGGDRFLPELSRDALSRHAGGAVLRGAESLAAGALLLYLEETRKTTLPRIIFTGESPGYMELDIAAIRGLELVASNSTGEKKGSLLWALDKTRTPMGRRLLRAWVLRPLTSPVPIMRRLQAVDDLARESVARGEIAHTLSGVGDIERLCGKVIYGGANARDLLALAKSLDTLSDIPALLEPMRSAELKEIAVFDRLEDAADQVLRTVMPDPPLAVRDGGIIADGRDPEVDRLRGLIANSGGAMAELEKREREKTGIKQLKIGYTRVFGYFIEIPRSRSDDVPEGYQRRQTLANAERFVTDELKRLESDILSARERVAEMEYAIFTALCESVAAASHRISATAGLIAKLDAFCSLAEAAARNNYTMPEVNAGGVIDIKDGRHPVVELARPDTHFVPNDAYLDNGGNIAAVITGPNMAGKSTFMRQTALIVLMAQIGSFVPASRSVIGVVDRVFTRIGAADDLAAGKSTFMVEMTESAEILKNASRRSLIILDEIGRGTSTYDGVAIARAILEYCADRRRLGAKTMFSTHYHELGAMEREFPGVKCYEITAKRRGGELIFLRKITPGATKDSYGIDVARLAGLPESVIRRARAVMDDLSSGDRRAPARGDDAPEISAQVSFGDEKALRAAERLRSADLNIITPIEAMNLLFELQKEVRE